MANLPGTTAPVTPGAFSRVQTLSRGASIPGGNRVGVILGEGQRFEILVASATGKGVDGFNSAYTSIKGADGRHFALTFAPVIENRSQLVKNGIPLVGLEQAFDSTSGSFSGLYDYRLDVTTGHIELQSAALVDQGGKFYLANAINVGNGSIGGLSLLDVNAPSETWSIRCTSTKRDGYGNPIDGYGQFIAQGSVSGVVLDGYGNQVIWRSNGVSNSNTILQFSITDGSIKFREGDRFSIKVKGGALLKGDTLVANYIGEADLNDPEFFTDFGLLTKKHGLVSLDHRLSLGGQLAFANSPPGVWACQAAPSVPRRISYQLETSASGGITVDDLTFPLPLNVVPDLNQNIHFFVTDVTGTESQILPNKFAFYDSTATASPVGFTSQATGHSFSYTVVLENAVTKEATDGVTTSIGPNSATLSSSSVQFVSSDVGLELKILHPSLNAGVYTIASVTNGIATISAGSFTFTTVTGNQFEVIDTSVSSAQVLFTKDLALSAGQKLRATIVDTRDATFFDVGWQSAYQAIEAIEVDMVVPLPSQTISAIFQAGNIHCNNMSDIINRKERILLIGAIKGLTPDNVIGTTAAAVEDIGVLEGIQGDDVSEILAGNTEDLTNYSVQNAFGNTFRVQYFYPDEIIVPVGGTNTSVDGFFAAAAAMGFYSGVTNIAIPLTNKILAGFTILRNKLFRPIIVQNLSAAGIALLQPAIGGGKVIWGKTTTTSGFPEEEESSIVFIRDRVAKSLRGAFDGFVGMAETASLQGTLMARANAACQSFVGSGLITAFRDIKVIRDTVDPRQWNISASVQPTYPVNFVLIDVSIGLL